MIKNWLKFSILAMSCMALWGILFFIKVAHEVTEGDTHHIDFLIIQALRANGNLSDPLGPIWVEDFARDITALGSPPVLTLFILITVLFLILIGQRLYAVFVAASTLSGTAVVIFLKGLFDRARPNLMPENIHVYTESFPSGHAMISAVVYLSLGILISRLLPQAKLKAYVMLTAFTLTGIVGFTRVYLGVHWPTDVLAGWAVGAAWAFGGGAIVQSIHLAKMDES